MWFRFALSLVCLANGSITFAASPEDVTALVNQHVELLLEDGRRPRGLLSPQSSEEWIVLQAELPDIVLNSRFALRSVRQVEPVTGPRSPEPELTLPPAPNENLPLFTPPFSAPFENPFPCNIPTCAPQPFPCLQPMSLFPAVDRLNAPRSLQIETRLANWNADPEMDGLLMRVTPLDAWGQVVATDGHLDVELVTETRLATGGRTVSRADPFAVSERWSVPVQAINFEADGVTVQLPFRRINPEWNYDIAPDALVLARLRVPTAGTFEARDSQVTLRRTSRFRDDLFLRYGPR
ncbi:MAG TPA: hypothetical protein VFG20_22015 [Planctomycetaceae bacterium]|nr:hypothetical protein [Planctomycetaceae bacterium]